MANVTLTQFSFNRGELDPALHGRSDWKYYYSGAEKLLNLIIRPQGGATKRGGLKLIAPALDDNRPSLLVPFRFSVKQSYMLEFGDRKMRIVKDGGLVTIPGGRVTAVIDTPYPYEALAKLRFAQTADVMVVTHPDYPPRRLVRHDHHDWKFNRLVSDANFQPPDGLKLRVSGGDGAKYVVTAVNMDEEESGPSDSVTAFNGDLINMPDADAAFSVFYEWQRQHDYSCVPEDLRFHEMSAEETISFLMNCGYQDQGIRYTNGGRHWRHIKPDSKVVEEASWWPGELAALVRECLYACDMDWAGSARARLLANMQDYVDNYNAEVPGARVTTLAWNQVEGAARYHVYRERTSDGEVGFRLVGIAGYAEFTDDNRPTGELTLPTVSELFSDMDGYPGVCAFFEQRLVLARTNAQPTTFWGSDTGRYNSFTRHTPIEDSDHYEFTLASGEMNEINWIVPLNDMLLGTAGGEWKAGGGGYAITPSNVNARVQSWYGCGALPPVVVGRTVIFASRNLRTLRSFSYSLEADGYSGKDLTVYAHHLFSGREIVSMCYQQEPSGILWVVLSDGSLVSCTFAPEEDVVAWSRHETKGRFECCGSLVDVDGSDQVYFCVAREVGGVTRRFIETLEDAADRVANECDGVFLDSSLSYQGQAVGRVAGLDHLEGESVSCLADGSVFENLIVEDGGVALPGGFTASVIHAGIPYRTELATLDLEPEDKETLRNRARFVVSAAVRFHKSRDCLYSHSDGGFSEIKFRTTEFPGRPIRLFTGEKSLIFSSPPGVRTTRIRFVTDTPTPFTLLGVIAEASCGQPA